MRFIYSLAGTLAAMSQSLTHATPMMRQYTIALVPPTASARGERNLKSLQCPSRFQHKDHANLNSLDAIGNNFNSDAQNKDLIVRGGSTTDNTPGSDTSPPPSKLKKIVITSILSALVITAVLNRESIAAFNFKEELATQLDVLSSLGTKGLIMYIFAFMIWEVTVGVTTPVETAAAMAFGLKKGVVANAIGKTSGALIAFLLGRYVLKDFVEDKLKGNEYMDLVQDSIIQKPIRVALIWRFSFLPEQIKNFGLAVLPVKPWQFLTAVLMHGFPFTLLWSFIGNEMGLVVRGVLSGPSRTLKIMMGGVYVFGFFISPSLVGLWIKGLRDEKKKKDAALAKQ